MIKVDEIKFSLFFFSLGGIFDNGYFDHFDNGFLNKFEKKKILKKNNKYILFIHTSIVF
jgi:hypothetical protein